MRTVIYPANYILGQDQYTLHPTLVPKCSKYMEKYAYNSIAMSLDLNMSGPMLHNIEPHLTTHQTTSFSPTSILLTLDHVYISIIIFFNKTKFLLLMVLYFLL